MHKNKPVNFAPAKQQKCENAPGKARKRRNRVRFGCWRGWQRLGTDKTRCEKPKFEPKRTPFPCTTCKKKPGRNTVFPPGLWQGQKDLVSPAASGAAPRWGAPSTDRGGSRDRRSRVPPARTRPSARGFGVDVGGRTRERKRAGVARFLSQVLERAVLVWCCGKFPCVFYDLRVSCFRNSLGEQPAYF